jgi:transcriptional regulator with XRE-family HTH domain
VSTKFNKTIKLLALNLKRERKRAMISQEELAFKADIDRTYASQIERGIANPSLKVLCDLATALNCEIEKLIS